MLPLGFLHDLRASPASAFLLLRHGCFFALGGMLWLRQSRPLGLWWTCLLGLCLLGGMAEIFDSARDIIGPAGDSPQKRVAVCVVWLVAVALMAAAIHHQQLLRRMLGSSAKTIKQIGLMTYPLYLLHDVIGAALMKAAFLTGVPPLGALGFAVAAVLVLSWVVTQFLEPPVRAVLRALLSRPALVTSPKQVSSVIRPPPY